MWQRWCSCFWQADGYGGGCGDRVCAQGQQRVQPARRDRHPAQLDDRLPGPLDRQVLTDQEVQRERAQLRPVRHRRPGHPLGPGGHVAASAAAHDPVEIVLGHPDPCRGEVVGLVRAGDPDHRRLGQRRPAATRPDREVRLDPVRVLELPVPVRQLRPQLTEQFRLRAHESDHALKRHLLQRRHSITSPHTSDLVRRASGQHSNQAHNPTTHSNINKEPECLRPVLPAGRRRLATEPGAMGHGNLHAQDAGSEAPLDGEDDGPQA